MDTIQEVFKRYSDDLLQVEHTMERHLRSEVNLIPEVIQHLIGSGGKRFRPLLLLVTSDLCGYRGPRRYTLSAVIEFIHTATLLHDDVIDQAETRRGRTSANNIWGNAASVLVGDFLYSQAFRLMAADGDLAILQLLSGTTNTMSEGEVFQLVKCGDAGLTEQDYLTIIEKKTSVLMAATCATGGILGQAGPEATQALQRVGMALGSAFQITDDTLDYVAREEEFGKAIGKDLAEGKITLPLIYALSRCSAEEKRRAEDLLRAREEGGAGEILDLIQKYGGIWYAQERARRFIEEARAALFTFPNGPARAALSSVADYVIGRRL